MASMTTNGLCHHAELPETSALTEARSADPHVQSSTGAKGSCQPMSAPHWTQEDPTLSCTGSGHVITSSVTRRRAVCAGPMFDEVPMSF